MNKKKGHKYADGGAPTGAIGDSVIATGLLMEGLEDVFWRDKGPSLGYKIGLPGYRACGGRLFGGGGNVSEIGNSVGMAADLTANAVKRAQVADTSDVKLQIILYGNHSLDNVNSTDDLMNLYYNTGYNLADIRRLDLLQGKNVWEGLYDAAAQGLKGSGLGFKLTGNWIGAVVGGVAGSLASGIGSIFRRKNADKLVGEINNMSRTVNRANQKFTDLATNQFDTTLAIKEDLTWTGAEGGYLPFAFGGNLQTLGADFSNGLTWFNNGGTHELNPNGGVPLGIAPDGEPNLVEEGEVKFDDYILSNRLRVPKAIKERYHLKNKSTFADAAKKISKESEERPNDPISKNGLEAALTDLQESQEEMRASRKKAKVTRAINSMTPDLQELLALAYLQLATQLPTQEDMLALLMAQGYACGGHLRPLGGSISREEAMAPQLPKMPAGYYALKNLAEAARGVSKLMKLMQNPMGAMAGAMAGAGTTAGGDTTSLMGNAQATSAINSGSTGDAASNIGSVAGEISRAFGGPIPHKFDKGDYLYRPSDTDNTIELLLLTPWQQKLNEPPTPAFTNMPYGPEYQSVPEDAELVMLPVPAYEEGINSPFQKEIAKVSPEEARKTIAPKTNAVEKTITTPTKNKNAELYSTLGRLAPIVASGAGLINSLAAKPDLADLGRAEGLMLSVPDVTAPSITNNWRYNPYSEWAGIEPLLANAAANRTGLINLSSGNPLAAAALIIALNRSTGKNIGELRLAARKYNDEQRQLGWKNAEDVDAKNAAMLLAASQANQALKRAAAEFLGNTAVIKKAERQRIGNNKGANLSNFADNLGALGKENAMFNMINSNPAYYYSIGRDGKITYRNGYENLSDDQKEYIQYRAKKAADKKRKNGGYLTIKKRR